MAKNNFLDTVHIINLKFNPKLYPPKNDLNAVKVGSDTSSYFEYHNFPKY